MKIKELCLSPTEANKQGYNKEILNAEQSVINVS